MPRCATASITNVKRKHHIVHLFFGDCNPDPRTEKQARFLSRTGQYKVSIVAWHRYTGLKSIERRAGAVCIRLPPLLPEGFYTFPLWEKTMIKLYALCVFSVSAIALCRRLKPRVIQAHDLHTLHIGVVAHWMTGSWLLLDAHDDYPRMLSTMSKLLGAFSTLFERFWCPYVDHVLAADKYIADKYSKRYKKPVTIVKNFPESTFLSYSKSPSIKARHYLDTVRTRKEEGYWIALCVSMLYEHYGFEELLEAAKSLDSKMKLCCVLVGWGPAGDKLHRKVEVQQIKNILMTGKLPHEDIPHFLKMAHVGLSLHHPTEDNVTKVPAKMFEYLGAGLPVIAGPLPEVKALLDQGCGWIVDSTSPISIAEALFKMAQEKHRYDEMVRASHHLSKSLSWELEVKKISELFDRMVARPIQKRGSKASS